MQNKEMNIQSVLTGLLKLEAEASSAVWKEVATLLKDCLEFEALTILEKKDKALPVTVYQQGAEEVRVRSTGSALFSDLNDHQDVFPHEPLILNYPKKAPGRFNSMLLLPVPGTRDAQILLKFGNNTPNTFQKPLKNDYALLAMGLSLWHKGMIQHNESLTTETAILEQPNEVPTEPVENTSLLKETVPVDVENYEAVSRLIELLPHVIETRNQYKLRRLADCLQKAWSNQDVQSETDKP